MDFGEDRERFWWGCVVIGRLGLGGVKVAVVVVVMGGEGSSAGVFKARPAA